MVAQLTLCKLSGRGMHMLVSSFAEIQAEFVERAHRAVWCNLASIDAAGRPRSRVVHTIWDGQTGWIVTRANAPKLRDLARDAHVSLAYVSDLLRPLYVECRAEWLADTETKRRVWALFQSAPPPLGFDPVSMFGPADDPGFGVVKFEPYQISLENVSGSGERRRVWRAPA